MWTFGGDPISESNRIGNLILHLEGNVNEWMLSGVGGKSFKRVRQQEFDERLVSRRELIKRLRKIVAEADAVFVNLNRSLLNERRRIQERDVTVLRAIYHIVEHFSMHTGQIMMLTKSGRERI